MDPQLFLDWLSRHKKDEVTHKVLFIVEKPEFNEDIVYFSNLEFLILKPSDSAQPFHKIDTILPRDG